MTKRQRYLAALRNQPTDGALVWAPNFDYWLSVNRAQGTVPIKYRNMSRNDIARAVDGTIWNRATALSIKYDHSVKNLFGKRRNGIHYHEIRTPLGNIHEEFTPSESEHATMVLTKHFVTDLHSLRIMTYAAEAAIPAVDFESTQQAMDETGEDGIVLHQVGCVPLIQFAKNDAGYMNAFYLLEDYPEEVNNLIRIHHKKTIEAYKLLSASPADALELGDNMDEVMISPQLFERYAVDFYQECKEAIKDSGKLLEVHWCGRTKHLLPLLPKTGVDVVEAVVTEPMADISLEAALDILDGRVALQGGIPSILVCPEAISGREFEHYIESVVLKQKGRPGFVLGMADNVPPNADFRRVEMIGEMVH